jgi:hypothetical protein
MQSNNGSSNLFIVDQMKNADPKTSTSLPITSTRCKENEKFHSGRLYLLPENILLNV